VGKRDGGGGVVVGGITQKPLPCTGLPVLRTVYWLAVKTSSLLNLPRIVDRTAGGCVFL